MRHNQFMQVRLLLWLAAGSAATTNTWAQLMMQSGPHGPRIHGTDLAVLEAGDTRKDLPCSLQPDKAYLGFDMRFHSGFDVQVPLKELAGNENMLTMLFRVTPDGQPESAKYFVHRIRVPQIEEEAKGDTYLEGGFDLGEGKYKVDWLMRDRAERVCAHSWDVEASLPAKDKQMALVVPANAVEQMHGDQFQPEPAVQREPGEGLHVKIVMNFAPQRTTASALKPTDLAALVAILRTLSRDPRIARFTLVAFNMNDQKVFHRQELVERIDFPALGKSMNQVAVGTVNLKHMVEKHSSTTFLTKLIGDECGPSTRADAVVFAGPKAMLDQNVPSDEVKALELAYPVFYMNYILNPQATPWRDAIGVAVKQMKGVEYTITRPRDLWFSISEMVGRIVKFRNGKTVAAVSSQ